MTYPAKEIDGRYYVDIYLPARTAVVLKEGRIRKSAAERKAPACKAPVEKKTITKKAPAKKSKKTVKTEE